ncbi:MAG: type VI secretion system contractile sheath large subunit [Planctomycetaceae bacterium]|nr:type VI secretion system contractile sheath large subunit [Planctomycetaceae bacterium]
MHAELQPDSASSLPNEIGDAAREPGLLDQLLEHAVLARPETPAAGPLSAGGHLDVVTAILGRLPGSAADLRVAKRKIAGLIAGIDELMSEQVNAILHQPEFQSLESAWRGLRYLWEVRRSFAGRRSSTEVSSEIQIRVLNVRKSELQKDLENAVEFDQSQLFRKVYEEEFGTPGGTPYGILIGNYEFTNHPDDIDLMKRISGVAAAAFAPFVASGSTSLLGIEDFSTLEQPINLESIFRNDRYTKWRSLRRELDTRFLGLTVPRVLMRAPYQDDGGSRFGFRFREAVEGKDRSKFLWGSAAWAFGAIICRAFATSAWFADIRGVQRGVESGGLVTGLASHPFRTDASGAAERSSVEVQFSEAREAELCEQGFIPISHCKDTPYSAFYANGSVNEPEKFGTDEQATANARLSAMLQYVLCCSRLAHYLKVKVRDRIGSHESARQIEDDLICWLNGYVTPDDQASPEMKARYPLRNARVEITEVPGRPGQYDMTMFLQPHYQLDQLSSTISFVASRVELGS